MLLSLVISSLFLPAHAVLFASKSTPNKAHFCKIINVQKFPFLNLFDTYWECECSFVFVVCIRTFFNFRLFGISTSLLFLLNRLWNSNKKLFVLLGPWAAMGKGKKSAYIKFKYDKSKHCQCGTGTDGFHILYKYDTVNPACSQVFSLWEMPD